MDTRLWCCVCFPLRVLFLLTLIELSFPYLRVLFDPLKDELAGLEGFFSMWRGDCDDDGRLSDWDSTKAVVNHTSDDGWYSHSFCLVQRPRIRLMS